MIADYYTKPLQGALFRKMRNIVMGLAPFPAEERVDSNRIVAKSSVVENTSTKEDVEYSKKAVTAVINRSVTYADSVRTARGHDK